MDDDNEKEEIQVEEEKKEETPAKKEEEKEAKNEEKKEEKKEKKKYLCKKVAIDWHGVLADSDNRVSEDSLCAVEKLLAKGIRVTILSYGGHDRNKQTLECLGVLRIFEELQYQFCSKKVGPYGKAAWCRHLGIAAVFDDDDDDAKINQECWDNDLHIFPVIGRTGDHSDLAASSGGKVIPSHNLADAIDQFLQR